MLEIYRIVLTDKTAERLFRHMSDAFREVHSASGLPVRFEMLSPTVVQCIGLTPDFQLVTHGPDVYRESAEALAELVLAEYEPALIRRMIRRQYRVDDPAEALAMEKYCSGLLTGAEWEEDAVGMADRARRKEMIARELELYLSENTEINLTGFIDFRMSQYREELREITVYAVDEFVLDRQYREFISLLKYFVCLQEVKVPLVHLFHQGGNEFMLCDERLKKIEVHNGDRIIAEMLESEMNVDDMVISSLITVSPKQICIHTREPELQVIRTIETIFDSRVTLCIDCPSCASRLGEAIRP
ncbi:putative sporulation protein YtxC [Paenibacillus cisolokensis]|uniref:Sporulation protein n=1 Tax=Paenibacillus cisolokensis TaxID=1658519 RepID=A0ABQ4N8H1_9BACL|nr:putative sporulation protein YtxC [Paenibacillus sp. 32O-W]ALS26806.1 sporulation protein YtxC [Paenibacillus sp. 32O-W]GIQ64466.1 hypothetical protein PACILC2_30340 [Paenibacillus cisolokensis]